MPGTEFPAFLKLEYRRDQSAGRAMLADIDDTLGQAERRFGEFGEEAKRQLDAALSVNRNSFGALDVGVDQARSVAAALKQRATAAREVAAATATAAREAGDYSQQARLAVAAAEALAIEEERAAASALSHAKALEQVQAAYDPLKARVQAGDTTAYDDFSAAARALLDIERQISGSQGGFFSLYGEVRSLAKTGADASAAAAGSAASAASKYPSPFAPVTIDNTAVVGGLGDLAAKLDAVNDNLGKLDAVNANLGTIILQGNLTGTDSLSPIFTSKGFF